MKRNKRGITLIALIITVIVLLILAGTAISIAINSGDVFNKSKQAREEWNTAVSIENAAVTEVINLLDSIPNTDPYEGRANESEVHKDWFEYEIVTPATAKIDDVVSSVKVADVTDTIRIADNASTGTAYITEVNLDLHHTENVSKIVIPTTVKLNSEGKYDEENGATYTIIGIKDEFARHSHYAGIQNAMRTVVIPNTVTYIGPSAFVDCTALESVVIPSSVTVIKAEAFNGCENLSSIVIKGSNTTIEDGAFKYCSGCPHKREAYMYYGESRCYCRYCESFGVHNIVNDVCTICGFKCEHEWSTDGTCEICGKVCNHDFKTYFYDGNVNMYEHKCSICGATEYHNMVNGECTICGYICEHEWSSNGECINCNMACQHSFQKLFYGGSYDPNFCECSICGMHVEHEIVNGVCQLCGYEAD